MRCVCEFWMELELILTGGLSDLVILGNSSVARYEVCVIKSSYGFSMEVL